MKFVATCLFKAIIGYIFILPSIQYVQVCNFYFIQVFYDNSNHDGQMLVSMKVKLHHSDCDDDSDYREGTFILLLYSAYII